MATWILQPRDTLLLRDARPSSEGAGGLRSLDFPWPSSLAGLIRTRIGSAKSGQFDLEVNKAKQIPVRGPLLVELTANGEVAANDEGVPKLLVPAPCDCVWYRAEPTEEAPTTHFVRRRLEPVNYREQFPGFETDLDTKPYGTALTKYLLRHACDDATGKPVTGAAFWRWNDFQTWLTNPVSEASFPESTEPGEGDHPCFRDFGQPALVREQRTHVRIDAAAQTAEDGMLFVTELLRFTRTQKGAAPLELGLLFSCEYQDPERPLRPGLVTFGGERKLSALASTTATLPSLPPTLQTTLERNRADGKSLARVVLLTPALFKDGFAPEWIGNETVKVVAAAVPRPQVVSGWDHELDKNKLEQKGPKPNRRIAPAGSVYWVELPQDLDIEKWLKSVWMQSLSNQMTDQDAKDSFGLCAVGVG